MGLIRFAVEPATLLDDLPEAYRGYLTGSDGHVFVTRIEVQEAIIGCHRKTSESCKFHVAWPVTGFGRPVIATASLSEREQPYLLPLELARGKIVQLRNQAGEWELSGMTIPPDFVDSSRLAFRAFAKAASRQNQPEEATRLSNEALCHACAAAEILMIGYSSQTFLNRLQRFGSLPASIGCELHQAPPHPDADELFAAAFNSATVACAWEKIESKEKNYDWTYCDQQLDWCEKRKLLVKGGPLIDLGPHGLPSWLARGQHDRFYLEKLACDFVKMAISRYFGRIRIWEVATRLNSGGALSLSEEDILTLVVRVLDVARQLDEETQLLIRIDQPWGEYQARGQHRLSPMQLVDALLRSSVGLAGVNLELAVGYLPRGSAYRDLLDISRLIDMWSILGVPLHATLACPSSSDDDALASESWEVEPRMWDREIDETGQAEWIERILELLLAKQSISSVSLAHFSDGDSHTFPQAGLLRADGTPKAALERIMIQHQRNKRQD